MWLNSSTNQLITTADTSVHWNILHYQPLVLFRYIYICIYWNPLSLMVPCGNLMCMFSTSRDTEVETISKQWEKICFDRSWRTNLVWKFGWFSAVVNPSRYKILHLCFMAYTSTERFTFSGNKVVRFYMKFYSLALRLNLLSLRRTFFVRALRELKCISGAHLPVPRPT